MTKRKLTGVNVKKLPKKKKKKMQKALDIMHKNREKDNRILRDVMIAKLKWAENEKLKGLNQIKKLKFAIARIEGIILAYKDVLNPSKIETKK